MTNDIFGQALLDYFNGNAKGDITTISSLEETDVLPLKYLFRTYDDMPELEQLALSLCNGKVLDVGCGVGGHSLYLQEKGFDVTALDTSTGAIEVCKKRGLKKVVNGAILDYSDEKFDTLLLLMNGIGLVGTLANLASFFNHAKTLLNEGGCIILDSSDIIYMYETEEETYETPEDFYYGEVAFTMSYNGTAGAPFSWLYIDFLNLENLANKNGLHCELIAKGEHYDYLAKLTIPT